MVCDVPENPLAATVCRSPETLVRELLSEQIASRPFSELFNVTLDHRVQPVVGRVILNALAERGITTDDFDAVGALTAAAVPLVTAVIEAASRCGESLDGFIMDFVYPSIKGPSIANKRVVLLDAWLSEKSYIQTSSLVTLHSGTELNLDFGVMGQEGATVVAIASLMGSSATEEGQQSSITVVDPLSGQSQEIPFIAAFDEYELRQDSQS